MHLKSRGGALVLECDGDRSASGGVVQGILHQVAHELRESVRIAPPSKVSLRAQHQLPLGVGHAQRVDGAAAYVARIAGYEADGDAASQSPACEVEPVSNHPPHPLRAGGDAVGGANGPCGQPLLMQQVGSL